jgi:hypothetical protein
VCAFKLEVLTPRGKFFEGDVEFINFYNSMDKVKYSIDIYRIYLK